MDPTMTETTTETTKTPEKRWYVIHTYSGYENKVKANLEHRIESMGMEDRIFQVLVPMEDEIEIRQGQRHTVQKKVSWPTREQVRNLTVLVFVVSFAVGAYITVLDSVFTQVVKVLVGS